MSAAIALDPRLVAPLPCDPADTRAELLAEDVIGLRLPLAYPGTPAVNCYLLRGDDGWTLVDCGSAAGAGWHALARALALAGVAPRAITTLVLTHLHPDHAGLAHEVVAHTGCTLQRLDAPATSNDALREPTLSLERRRRIADWVGVPPDALAGMLETPVGGDMLRSPPPAALLRPGDRVGAWTVVPAAGHSPNQLALHDPARGWVISADAAYAGIMPFLEWGHTPDPVAEYLATLDRIEALEPTLLLPGHGRPDDRPRERLAAARRALAETLARIRGPGSPYEIAVRLTASDPDPNRRQSMLSVVLSALRVGGPR